LDNKAAGQYGMTNHAFANVNLAKKDKHGRYVVAESLAVLFSGITSGWDGLFFDTYCSSISWSQVPAESIDFDRAGYADVSAFDVGWRAGGDTLAARLRQRLGPDFLLVGN